MWFGGGGEGAELYGLYERNGFWLSIGLTGMMQFGRLQQMLNELRKQGGSRSRRG